MIAIVRLKLDKPYETSLLHVRYYNPLCLTLCADVLFDRLQGITLAREGSCCYETLLIVQDDTFTCGLDARQSRIVLV